jgi:DNA-binding HxlR family transcriptional regulator
MGSTTPSTSGTGSASSPSPRRRGPSSAICAARPASPPGNLSRHLTVLEEAGLVQVEKGYQGRRPRTWVRITGSGRAALAAEFAALTELVRRHGVAKAKQPGPA